MVMVKIDDDVYKRLRWIQELGKLSLIGEEGISKRWTVSDQINALVESWDEGYKYTDEEKEAVWNKL